MKKVLMIEDNEMLSDMYKFKLTYEWFDVFIENDSLNAIKSFEEFQPEIITLDIMMPWLNWYEILEILRKDLNSDVIIIMLSNVNSDQDKEKAINLWANKFLLKANVTPQDLVAEINIMFEW
jgi:DNA-binding response OmpR family regulator